MIKTRVFFPIALALAMGAGYIMGRWGERDAGLFVQVLSCVAAFSAVYVYWRQWNAMNEALRETRRSVEIAERTLEAAERPYQPDVQIRVERLQPGQPYCQAIFSNEDGKGAAAHCVARGALEVVARGAVHVRFSAEAPEILPASTILPGQVAVARLELPNLTGMGTRIPWLQVECIYFHESGRCWFTRRCWGYSAKARSWELCPDPTHTIRRRREEAPR